jgi:hypothetical protein
VFVQAKIILWEQGPSVLWSGVQNQRPVLVVEQACLVSQGPGLRARQRRLSEVRHPSLARVLEVGWSERAGVSQSLLERVSGVPVAALHFAVCEYVLLGALEQLAGALAACHRRGLALGSVNPGRVLLSRRPEITLVLTGAAAQGTPEQDVAGLAQVCRELSYGQVLSRPFQLLLSALDRGLVSAEQAQRSASAIQSQVAQKLRMAS